jgi:hypothetical protein
MTLTITTADAAELARWEGEGGALYDPPAECCYCGQLVAGRTARELCPDSDHGEHDTSRPYQPVRDGHPGDINDPERWRD